ncbi:ABC transporter ATP-binding protein [Shewanella sp. YIC-542]|uniref:ABC transporter ATP-binding protein n=1 Tax=Shewanella mytili TaxID=3377111 RepID=UPI00398E7265
MKLLQCRKLSKRYSDKLALDNVSLQLDSGNPIALVGPNGAGKTTLMSLLLGFIKPSSGDIRIFNAPPGSPKLLGKVSALPQDAALDPDFSLLKQLSLYARLRGYHGKAAEREAQRVLALVGLSDVAHALPKALSHGMGKRAAIAQALLGRPKLVLLDEPTAGLDPANARKVRELISQLSGDITFVISSHNLEELEKLCSKVLYLDQGKLGQAVDLATADAQSYLTLQMQPCDMAALRTQLLRLTGVEAIQPSGQQTLIIKYQPEQNPALDIQLLQFLQQQQLTYRMLLNGRTLEDQLFS